MRERERALPHSPMPRSHRIDEPRCFCTQEALTDTAHYSLSSMDFGFNSDYHSLRFATEKSIQEPSEGSIVGFRGIRPERTALQLPVVVGSSSSGHSNIISYSDLHSLQLLKTTKIFPSLTASSPRRCRFSKRVS